MSFTMHGIPVAGGIAIGIVQSLAAAYISVSGISEAFGQIYVSDTLGRLVPYAIFVLIMLFLELVVLKQIETRLFAWRPSVRF